MAVNKFQPHLVVIMEDEPYRELINAVVNKTTHIDNRKIDIRPPSGGWTKVFAALDEYDKRLTNQKHQHMLLLMDFDYDFTNRIDNFYRKIKNKPYESRVFLLGIDNKEFENLKQHLGLTNTEAIGTKLVENFPQSTPQIWNNQHLACNLPEIKRMRKANVFDWLFK